MSVEVKCDLCTKLIDPPIVVFKKDQYVKVRLYTGGTKRSLRLDLCKECSKELLNFLGIENYEELAERIEKSATGDLVKNDR